MFFTSLFGVKRTDLYDSFDQQKGTRTDFCFGSKFVASQFRRSHMIVATDIESDKT